MTNPVIRSILDEEVVLNINIIDHEARVIGHLRPITKTAPSDGELIQKLTDWRNRFRGRFFTQFTATFERTRSWLRDVVLADDTRLLFMINSNDKLMGHIGFKDLGLHGRSAELDNLIRGEMEGHRQLTYYAEVALIHWMFKTLEIDLIYACPLADNSLVLKLHYAVGFEPTATFPLFRVEQAGEIRLEMGEPGSLSPYGLYARRIDLSADRFKTLRAEDGNGTQSNGGGPNHQRCSASLTRS
jgi:RimJ/RimL family protein N-acetyltransferase